MIKEFTENTKDYKKSVKNLKKKINNLYFFIQDLRKFWWVWELASRIEEIKNLKTQIILWSLRETLLSIKKWFFGFRWTKLAIELNVRNSLFIYLFIYICILVTTV